MIEIYGIINATPDSFFAGSRAGSEGAIVEAALRAVEGGADVLDVGGYSTRPGYSDVSEEEEFSRLSFALGVIRREFPRVRLSVDTFRSGVVRRLYDLYGEFVVNDVEGGVRDGGMLPLVGELSLSYVMMSSGASIGGISDFFERQVAVARGCGVEDIMLDPGFGFGKSLEENYGVLSGMERLRVFGLPIFVGVSRKSMIWRPLGVSADEALGGTMALNFAALERGADILRVHDVREARDVVTLYEMLRG